MTLGNSLRGALRWSAAEEAQSRIASVRKTVDDTAPGHGAAQTQQLRHGLGELDAVGDFLRERISACNREFVDGGTKDEMLAEALAHGLTELDAVRRRVVESLAADAASRTRPPPKQGGPTLPKSRPGSATRPRSAPGPSTATRRRTAPSAFDRLAAPRGTQPPAHASAPGGAGQGDQAPLPRTRPNSAAAASRMKANAAARLQHDSDRAAGRSRPSSAPSRPRTGPGAQGTAGTAPAADDGAGGGAAFSSGQWGHYQDWAQRVMHRVSSRRVHKHRQSLSDSRSGWAPGSSEPSTPTTPLATPPEPKPAAAQPARPPRPTSATNRRPSGPASRPGSSAARPSSAAAAGRLDAGAQALREQGNVLFQQKRYSEAAESYGKAIAIETTSETLYCNRAAAYLMACRFQAAHDDARRAMELDPHHLKAHWRAAKASLYLSRCDDARELYGAALRLCDNGGDTESIRSEMRAVELLERYHRCARLRDFAEAVRCADGILEVFPPSGPCAVPWQCLRLEALLHTAPTDAATALTKLTQEEPQSSEAWLLRAKAVFYTAHDAVSTTSALGFLNRARELEGGQHPRAALLYNSIDNFARLRDEGNAAYAGGRWQESYVAYTKCLAIDPYNASLKAIILCNRAAVCIQCERWGDALEDINQSVTLNPQNAKAYTRRARIHQQQGAHDAAVRDLQLAAQIFPSPENNDRLQQALDARARRQQQQQHQQQGFDRRGATPGAGPQGGQGSGAGPQGAQGGSFRFFNFGSGPSSGASGPRPQSGARQRPHSAHVRSSRPSAPPTHYEVLGVSRAADDRAVVKAYRDAALKWHPDKWACASDAEKATAEAKFKDVSAAYNTLRDAQKRRQYDVSLF